MLNIKKIYAQGLLKDNVAEGYTEEIQTDADLQRAKPQVHALHTVTRKDDGAERVCE